MLTKEILDKFEGLEKVNVVFFQLYLFLSEQVIFTS